ncbi:MAG: MarR family transcriptional regulator [Gemmatimonadetes bacterium]|nr:MarR family transcriptional regulator [Gemmatimonadota bacterium]
MRKGEKKRRKALDAYGTLQRAAAFAAAQVDDALNPFGLSASQYGVLDTLQQRGPVHQQELAEALGRSKAQMTAIIDALEHRELVRRERHAVDRRFISVHLTEAGRNVLAEATPARTEAIVALMRELSGDQRQRLTRLCRRLFDAESVNAETRRGDNLDINAEAAEEEQGRGAAESTPAPAPHDD